MNVSKIFTKMALVASVMLSAGCSSDEEATEQRTFYPGETVPQWYVDRYGSSRFFSNNAVPDTIFQLMQGKTYKADCVVPRDSLRYILCLHKDIYGVTKVGEMVVNTIVADDVLEIFRELYDNGYPIERMRLIDYYDAVDEESMRDNNSSSFNFRFISGTTKVSKHGRGVAIDINTLYNPYFRHTPDSIGIDYSTIEPATALPYVDRRKEFPYKITKGDLCYNLFIKHGFIWGGEWFTCKDYQHFELP